METFSSPLKVGFLLPPIFEEVKIFWGALKSFVSLVSAVPSGEVSPGPASGFSQG